MALAIVLRSATERLVVGHVVHDLRPRPAALADRDAARALADRLGVPFVEDEVRVRDGLGGKGNGKGQTNLEALARRHRYAALAALARRAGIEYVAVAHHADDQLENVLMSLVRGAGVRGMPVRRRLAAGVTLVRPMLCGDHEVTREECRRICRQAGVEWREDATNADTTRLRAAIRAEIVPTLKSLRPAIARHAVQAADELGAARRVVGSAAQGIRGLADVQNGVLSWPRTALRDTPSIVVGELIRRVRHEILGPAGADRFSKLAVDRAVRAIRDDGTDPRTIDLAELTIRISAAQVGIQAVEPGRGRGRVSDSQ